MLLDEFNATQRRAFLYACGSLACSLPAWSLAPDGLGAMVAMAGGVVSAASALVASGWLTSAQPQPVTAPLLRPQPRPQPAQPGPVIGQSMRQPRQNTMQRQAASYVAPVRTGATGLEADARAIHDFLRKRKIRCRIAGGFPTPAYYIYRLEMDIDEKYENLEKALDDMERVLHESRLAAGRISGNDVTVIRAKRKPPMLEINRADPRPLLINEIPRSPQPFQALLGMMYSTKQGTPITWEFTESDSAHLLIAGMTGSGKSNLLVSLLLDMCAATRPDELQVYLVDGGNADLKPLADLPHVQMYVDSVDEVGSVFTSVEAEMIRRKQENIVEPHIMLAIEELGNLALSTQKSVLEERIIIMSKLAQEGRKWGIHIIACTQKPNANVIGTFVKSNIATRCCGVVATKADGNTALGVTGTGAERLPPKRGAFMYRSGESIQSIQVPFIEDPARTVQQIYLQRAPVQTTRVQKTTFAPVQTLYAPVRTGAAPGQTPILHQSAPAVHQRVHQPAPVFPLATKRPLTRNEMAEVRRLATTMSKNKLCEHIYGSKSSRYMRWLEAAL